MIFLNSRYRFADSQYTEDAQSNVEFVHRMRSTVLHPELETFNYTVRAGDTMESLAYKFYNDGDKWYAIADANPPLFWPLDLLPGTVIRVPSKSVAALL